ncbi:MAG TPA: hypothetical protein P5572_20735 [Phycisphaerae bacterium]|nr:hypothetical protein [Phycisphaerales bacterium]HRX87459.1 hypothetical protein [Phycisphaerae bacterium]
MSIRFRRPRRGFYALFALAALVGVLSAACSSDLFAPSARSATPVGIRVENATDSTVRVQVEALDANGDNITATGSQAVEIPVVTVDGSGVSFGVLDPIGASAAAAGGTLGNSAAYATDATVRVPGYSTSQGPAYCGEWIRVTAKNDADDTDIRVFGAGSGTRAFDSGSVGETGERYFLSGVDFECGQTIIVRVAENESGTGSSTMGTAAVVSAGEGSPFDPIVPPGTGEGTPTTITVEVQNTGAVIGTLRMDVTTSAGGTQEFVVTVPPDAVTAGDFACGTQFKFTATYPDPETPEDQDTERIVILSGDGTGAIGFDDASVSRTGERYLVVGEDVACGDTVRVTLHDDLAPIGFSGISAFSGEVTVTGGE